jgi:hypothetical protein
VRGVPTANQGDFLLNKHPDYDYAFCNPLDKQSGLDWYVSLGWDIVKWTDDPSDVRIRVGRTGKPGDVMSWMDQVVVCIPKELNRQLRDEGVPGLFRGRNAFEAMDRKISGKRGRGIMNPETGSVGDSRHESILVETEMN